MASATTTAVSYPGETTLTLSHLEAITGAVAATGTFTLTDVLSDGEEIVIGDTTYTAVDALTETAATGTLTLTGNASDGEVVTIETRTYTFRDVADNAFEVLIGGNASDTLDNLIAAINASGIGNGTDYGPDTTEHPAVDAAAGSGDTMDVTALVVGVSGNSIDTTTDLGNGSWGAAVLQGGVASVANEVLVEASASDVLDNLIAAINGTAGSSGTTYSSATVANTQVTAVAGDGDTMDVTARTAGTVGNAIATTTDASDGSWGAATLENGAASSTGASDTLEVTRDGYGRISFSDGLKTIAYDSRDEGLQRLFSALVALDPEA